MDRCVLVHRCKRTGAFLLQPVDTPRGRGVSLDLYREVPTDAADEALGETVIDLLARSGPPGAALAEATPSSGASRDEETQRISDRYGVDRVGSTPVYARWFLLATVKQRPARMSWTVHTHRYDSRRQAMSGEDQPSVRVEHSAGAAALGGALRAALDAVACSGLWGPGGSASHRLTLRGLELHEARRYAAALPYFERALRLSPSCPIAAYNRANTLFMLERDAEAEPLLRGLIARSEDELGRACLVARPRSLRLDALYLLFLVLIHGRGFSREAFGYAAEHLRLRRRGVYSVWSAREVRASVAAFRREWQGAAPNEPPQRTGPAIRRSRALRQASRPGC
jgi:hypothetical protein